MKRPLTLLLILLAAWVIQCHDPKADQRTANAPLFDNLGSFHHPISTNSALAQRYFDQAMVFYYAFNYAEAIRSFRAGARLDPNCAMFYWGEAQALGPHVNEPMDGKAASDAFFAVQKALTLASRASAVEREYIHALSQRYALTQQSSREQLDDAFAKAMLQLARRHPEDVDAATLFAESVMVLSPWNYWTSAGKPQPNTPKILEALEGVLVRAPRHPGANHYYIHAVEAVHPGRAERSAKVLETAAPGAGHLVHMPSHVYLLLGQYEKAAASNRQAAKADELYIAECKKQGFQPAGSTSKSPATCGNHSYYTQTYYPHDLHFLWYVQCMQGNSAGAAESAQKFVAAIPANAFLKYPTLEMFLPVKLLTMTRFGKWKQILHEPKPAPELSYTTAIWYYARGMAFCNTKQIERACSELQKLEALTTQSTQTATALYGGAPALQLVSLAEADLRGNLAMTGKRFKLATKHFEEAVALQDALPFSEPPAWYYPVRQSLAESYLARHKPKMAEEQYRQDLSKYPENGWSLFGLQKALRAQGKMTEADVVVERFKKAWRNADVSFTE